MSEPEIQRISLKHVLSDDPISQVVGLLISLLTVLLLGILGLKLGIKITIFVLAALLGYFFFRGALFLTFLTFLALVSGMLFFKFPLINHLYVNIGPGEIMVLIVAIFFLVLYFGKARIDPDPFKVPLLVIFSASLISLVNSAKMSVSIFVLVWMVIGYLLYRWMIQFGADNVDRSFDFVIFIAAFFVILCVLHYSFSPYQVEVMEKYKSVFAGRYAFILAGPNSMAGVIATLFPVILLYIVIKRFPYKMLWITVALIATFVLYITASRNGYIASALASIAAVSLITSRKYRIPAVLSILAIVLFFSIVIFPSIMMRVTTIFKFALDVSALSRFILWQQALSAVSDNFITGVGVGTFFYLPMSLNMSIAHNQLLNMLAETGVIGGAGYIILLWFIFRSLISTYVKEKRENNIKFLFSGSLIASWIGFLFHNIFDGIWSAPHHTKEAMFFWLLLALTAICTRETYQKAAGQVEREYLAH